MGQDFFREFFTKILYFFIFHGKIQDYIVLNVSKKQEVHTHFKTI